jgi:hypothetical protein
MAKRGPKKPAREMTTQEAAERLFGERVIREVERELEETQPTEKPTKPRRPSSIEKKHS